MPKLLQRGCALEGCHSPDGFNDFRLRSGAQGFFSPFALTRNYETALKEFIALDTVDIKQSRAVKKTIFASSGGMTHRAGPVLDGSTPASNVADSAGACARRSSTRRPRPPSARSRSGTPSSARTTPPTSRRWRPAT